MKIKKAIVFFMVSVILLSSSSCSSQRKQAPPASEQQQDKNKGYLIFINRDTPSNYVMYSVDAEGKKKEKIYDKNPYGASGYDEKIAFISKESGEQSLYMINADGSSLTPIMNKTPVNNESLSWSPDGRWLAFSSRLLADKANEIYYVEAGKSKTPVRITNGTSENEGPRFSNGTRMILYAQLAGDNYDIFKFDMGKRASINLSNNSSNELSPVVSPDGTKIIFLSDEALKGKLNMYMMNIDGGNRTPLTTGLDIKKGSIEISPDSSMIAFVVSGEKGGKAVHVIDMNKATIMVSNGGYMATWSSDSKMLYYASSDPKNRRIVEYDVTGGKIRDVLKIEYKPGEDAAGIDFLHFTDKLK